VLLPAFADRLDIGPAGGGLLSSAPSLDATATTIRHAAVQLETPGKLPGRVRQLYEIASRGGPALGDMVIGAGAEPVVALTAGAACRC
jgi:hypothetical protein